MTEAARGITRRKALVGLGALAALLLVLDFLVRRHGYFGLDETPGFFIGFGFAAAVAAVLVAALWGRLFRRPGETRDD